MWVNYCGGESDLQQYSQLSIKMLGTRKPISCSGAARLENKTTDPAPVPPPPPVLSQPENRKQIKEKQQKVIAGCLLFVSDFPPLHQPKPSFSETDNLAVLQ